MPKRFRPAVDLMAFKCRTLKVKVIVNKHLYLCHLLVLSSPTSEYVFYLELTVVFTFNSFHKAFMV
jgi:hypothetical protein